MSPFEKAFKHVIGVEGGYSNHEADSGGATKYGITLQTLRDYNNDQTLTEKEVKNLALEESQAIYYSKYWKPLRLDEIQDELALLIFDQGVNRGLHSATMNVQQSLNQVRDEKIAEDGIMGPNTIEALKDANPKSFSVEFFKQSQLDYARIVESDPSQAVFIEGWLHRTHRMLDIIV